MYTDLKNRKIYDESAFSAKLNFMSEKSSMHLARAFSKEMACKVFYTDEVVRDGDKSEEMELVSKYFSEGRDMYELRVGWSDYGVFIFKLLNAMHAIESNGYTTDDNAVSVAVRNPVLREVNFFKLCASLPESEMISEWDRYGSAKLYPFKTKYFHASDPFNSKVDVNTYENFDPVGMHVPVSNRFGLGFSRVRSGVVEVNYVGGMSYEGKTSEVAGTLNEVMDGVAETLKDGRGGPVYDACDEFLSTRASLGSYDAFRENYPSLELYFDKKCEREYGLHFYDLVKTDLFKLVVYGDVKSGLLNYDSGSGRMQAKGVEVKQGFEMSGFDFVDCKLRGDFENCVFWGCELNASTVLRGRFYDDNKAVRSRIYRCEFGGNGNEMYECYVDNGDRIIHSDMYDCVYHGKVSYLSRVGKNKYKE